MRLHRNLALGRGTRRGGVGEPAIIAVTPTFNDTFNAYTDGTRLVAGDPNANAGLVATNPGNLGWNAILNGAPLNSQYNPIVFQGKIVARTANSNGSDFADPGRYLLAPTTTQSGDQYITAGLQPPGGLWAGISFKGTGPTDRVQIQNRDGGTVQLTVFNASTPTTIAGLGAFSGQRKMGGFTNGSFRPLTDANEQLTVIASGGRLYIRRGPGFPIGAATGYTFTDPAGTNFGVVPTNEQYQNIDFMTVGPAPTVLMINETFNTWYPKVRTSAGASITTGNATISFSGTYTGTAPSRLQWALFDPESGAQVKSWAWVPQAQQTIGGGNWSVSNLSVPCGLNGRKAYAIGFRPVDGTNRAQAGAAVVSVAHFYVTLNIALIGQSNSVNLTSTMTAGNYPDFAGSASYTKPDPPVTTQGSYAENTSYYLSTTDGGDKMNARLGDVLSTYFNVPVSFEVMAIAARSAPALGPAGADWSYILAHHTWAGNAFEAIYLSQGENEFNSGGSSWLTQWVDTNLPAYLALSGQPSGTVIPIFHAFTGRVTGANGQNTASTAACRTGQDGFVSYATGRLTNAVAVACHHYAGVKMVDAFHYTQTANEGYDEVSRRIALTMRNYWSGTGYNGMGPLATTATRSGATITIAFNLNGANSLAARDGTDQSLAGNASVLTSWEVSSDSFATTLPITSVVLSGNTVVITLASAPGGPVQVRNHFGFAPDITSWVCGLYGDGTYIGSKPVITPLVSN